MKQFAVVAALSVLSLVVHASLESVLSDLDLVTELVVRQSVSRAAMAAVLLGARVFLIFVAPAWSFAALVARR